jgi:kynurenine formamidase
MFWRRVYRGLRCPTGISRGSRMNGGDAFNTNMVLVFEHAGTHVDAPLHLGGVEGPGLDGVPAAAWMGELLVLGFR